MGSGILVIWDHLTPETRHSLFIKCTALFLVIIAHLNWVWTVGNIVILRGQWEDAEYSGKYSGHENNFLIMEVEGNYLGFLFICLGFFFVILSKDFTKESRNMNIWKKGGEMRFHLISSDMFQISWVFLGFLGLFLFHENIFTVLSQLLKQMTFYHAFVRLLHWNTEKMIALHKT